MPPAPVIQITPQEVLTVIGAAATLVTGIWHIAMYIGRLQGKVDRHDDRLEDHDRQLEYLRDRK